MPDLDVSTIIDDNGAFTDVSKLPELLGEQYKDTKFFETTPDLLSLMKTAVDTKSALGKKLEGIIQRPAKDATDKQKAEYRKALLKELGAPDSVEAYKFTPAEGATHNEELVKLFTQAFYEEGIPIETAQHLVGKWDAFQKEALEKHLQAEKDKFSEQKNTWQKAHLGDKSKVGGRIALKAILMYADESLTALLKDGRIMETPDDLDKWNSLGFSPIQLGIWERIGTDMKSDDIITDEGTRKPPEKGAKTAAPGADIFDHPTSVAARKASSAR